MTGKTWRCLIAGIFILALLVVLFAPVLAGEAGGATCPRCDGSKKCWVCSGSGKNTSGDPCSICSGTGDCYFCSGTGKI